MLKQAVGTSVALVMAAAAGLLWGCTSDSMRFLLDNSVEACELVRPLTIAPQSVWIMSFGSAAALTLSLTWVPVIRRKRRHAGWDHAFVANLKRIPQPVLRPERGPNHIISLEAAELDSDPVTLTQQTSVGLAERQEARPPLTNPLARDLARRVTVLQTLLVSKEAPMRQMTRSWISLLKQANELHNNGSLPTEEFRALNTRLLDLFGEQ